MEHLPQIIYLLLMGASLLLVANKHGQPKGDYDLGSSLFSTVIINGLLWWGGFFNGF